MRKILVALTVLLLSAPVGAMAQAPSFGLKGGVAMATFGGERIVTSEYRTGLSVGAFVSIPVTAAVAIQPELYFTQKGAGAAAYDYDDFPADGDAPPVGVYLSEETTHSYLEIPVLLKFSPSRAADGVRPALFVGPSIGFLLRVEDVHETDYEEYLNSTDVGLVIGGGLEFGKLSLDARYNLGLTTADQDYDGSFGHAPGGVKNRAFSVMAGFRIF